VKEYKTPYIEFVDRVVSFQDYLLIDVNERIFVQNRHDSDHTSLKSILSYNDYLVLY